MAYVAIRGGADAIAGSAQIMDALRALAQTDPIVLDQIERQLPFLHSRVLSEGGLYHPRLASLALKQALGDSLEAAFSCAHTARPSRVWVKPRRMIRSTCATPAGNLPPSRTFAAGRCWVRRPITCTGCSALI